MPAKHPHVARALDAGELSVAAASEIIRMLDSVAPRADADSAAEMEWHLVELAPGLTPDQLHKLIARAEAYLDLDGVEPRERDLRAERSLIIRQDREGCIRVEGRFDPETGASIVAALGEADAGRRPRRPLPARARLHEDADAGDDHGRGPHLALRSPERRGDGHDRRDHPAGLGGDRAADGRGRPGANATAGALSAGHRRGTWWRITCAGGCGTAEARISATASCSASPAITASTTTAGRYASRGRA
nr:DUF222 domain-containing protein [Microbacterium sp. EF45047]